MKGEKIREIVRESEQFLGYQLHGIEERIAYLESVRNDFLEDARKTMEDIRLRAAPQELIEANRREVAQTNIRLGQMERQIEKINEKLQSIRARFDEMAVVFEKLGRMVK